MQQTVELDNQGGYFPEVQEGALDYLTYIAIDQAETLSRTLQVPVTSNLNASALSDALLAVSADLTSLNAVAADLSNINLVAADLINTNAVEGNAANINAVALNMAAVITAAGLVGTSQAKNTVWAGPTTGSDAAPAFRGIVLDDLPSIANGAILGNASGATGKPTELSDDTVLALLLRPYLDAAAPSTQTLTNNTQTKIVFTAAQDNRGWWDAVNNRYVPKLPGRYRVALSLEFQDTTLQMQFAQATIFFNGSSFRTASITWDDTSYLPSLFSLTCEAIIQFNGTTDLVEATGLAQSVAGAALVNASTSYMIVEYLGS